MKKTTRALCLLLAVAASATCFAEMPATLLMDGKILARSKQRLQAGDAKLMPAYSNLLQNAEAALQSGPFSVMDKGMVPPSGSKHDYLSFGRYWWPDPSKPDGLPYIRRDGETNPGNQGPDNDRVRFDDMVTGVETLGLAYYFTGERRYAEKAAQLVRVWFLKPETRMNPNLYFAQGIPGLVAGRKTGVLDGRLFSRALDGVALISGSGALSASEQQALHEWFSEYLNWLKTNPNAREESEAKNNHSTFFDVQIMHVALFVGDADFARQVAQAAVEKRILAQIRPDGSMPEELARTRTLHYSLFNLEAMFLLARLADHTGVDLWHAGDSRIRAALDFLAPYADPAKPWPYPTVKEADRIRLLPLLLYAAYIYKDDSYTRLIEKLPPEKETCLGWLVVPLMR